MDCLHFIPDEELRIQYEYDEDTFVDLRVGESFRDAPRCEKQYQSSGDSKLKYSGSLNRNTFNYFTVASAGMFSRMFKFFKDRQVTVENRSKLSLTTMSF